eukprot:COSAG06_NODE_3897_length_4794_cov_2.890096_1_plen_109_part_00
MLKVVLVLRTIRARMQVPNEKVFKFAGPSAVNPEDNNPIVLQMLKLVRIVMFVSDPDAPPAMGDGLLAADPNAPQHAAAGPNNSTDEANDRVERWLAVHRKSRAPDSS